jgi:hypothetical protein
LRSLAFVEMVDQVSNLVLGQVILAERGAVA